MTTGEQLFNHHCAECHQEDARGKFFYGFPDLTALKLSIQDIKHQVQGEEAPGRNMPSFADMPDEDVTKIAEYVMRLKQQK